MKKNLFDKSFIDSVPKAFSCISAGLCKDIELKELEEDDEVKDEIDESFSRILMGEVQLVKCGLNALQGLPQGHPRCLCRRTKLADNDEKVLSLGRTVGKSWSTTVNQNKQSSMHPEVTDQNQKNCRSRFGKSKSALSQNIEDSDSRSSRETKDNEFKTTSSDNNVPGELEGGLASPNKCESEYIIGEDDTFMPAQAPKEVAQQKASVLALTGKSLNPLPFHLRGSSSHSKSAFTLNEAPRQSVEAIFQAPAGEDGLSCEPSEHALNENLKLATCASPPVECMKERATNGIHDESSEDLAAKQCDTPKERVVCIEVMTVPLQNLGNSVLDGDALSTVPIFDTVLDLCQKADQTQLWDASGSPISSDVAKALRIMLLGSLSKSFSQNWRSQALVYNQDNHYGLKFYKDGPVEVLVPLQACIIRNLLFESESPRDLTQQLRPCPKTQASCLVRALSDMLWRAGSRTSSVFALPTGVTGFIPGSDYQPDGITEKMELYRFAKKDELTEFLRKHLSKLQDPRCSPCVCLLYSIMLSRGLKRLARDCSTLKCGLIEFPDQQFSCSSQILINLCNVGIGTPLVCNGESSVRDDPLIEGETFPGIAERCDVGYMHFQEFASKTEFEVGSRLKTPLYPVWVVNCNGRLGVVFSLRRELLSDWKLERRFDLFYYGALTRHVCPSLIDVRLTLDTVTPWMRDEDEKVSQLEETLRTKWADAVIDWNGATRF